MRSSLLKMMLNLFLKFGLNLILFPDPTPTAHFINKLTNFGHNYFQVFFLPELRSGVHRGDPMGPPMHIWAPNGCSYRTRRGPVYVTFLFRSRTVTLRLPGSLTTLQVVPDPLGPVYATLRLMCTRVSNFGRKQCVLGENERLGFGQNCTIFFSLTGSLR